MIQLEKHKIKKDSYLTDALKQLNDLTYIPNAPLVLLVIEENGVLVGTVTDGDIRRALMTGVKTESAVEHCMKKDFHYLKQGRFGIFELNDLKKNEIWSVPILDENGQCVELIDLKYKKTVLPVDVVIMAGGRGQRLYPLTKNTPKPMLLVGGKPILEINVDRLIKFGVQNINISVNYLSEVITSYFDTQQKECNLSFVKENEPLGTIGSITLVEHFEHDYVLLMNSDLLTDIDYEDMLAEMIRSDADMSVASIPYRVSVPYAVFETKGKEIKKLAEKPTYTYHSNAGIYLIKKEFLKLIPKQSFYNATDLLQEMIDLGHKVIYYNVIGYWLDIGSPEDFEKAQTDISHLKL